MWQEARKHERRVKNIIVDYKKRAERRHDFYQRVRADPNQFLRINGSKCRILLDDQECTALIPWQAQSDNLIDRFDVRTHLETVPKYVKDESADQEESLEERQLNYERYRVLVQNEFLGISEEKFLHQLTLEEQFGTHLNHVNDTKHKKPTSGGAAIGFQYDDSGATSKGDGTTVTPTVEDDPTPDSSEDELDIDLTLDTNKITNEQAHELNSYGSRYGMPGNDFYSFLTKDIFEAEAAKLAQEDDQEKLLFGGRKSRRERRAHRERKMNIRLYDSENKPSYAKVEEAEDKAKESDSGSSSGPETEKITYITSFGCEDESNNKKPTDKRRGNNNSKKETSRSRYRRRSSRSRSRSGSPRRPSAYRNQNRLPEPRRRESPRRSRQETSSKLKTHQRSSPQDNHRKSSSSISTIQQPPPPPTPPETSQPPPDAVPIKSYYRRSLSTSSASSDGSQNGTADRQEVNPSPTVTQLRNKLSAPTTGRTNVAAALLKKKMQILLNKQYKEDKKQELMKKKQQLQEQEERENEMREIALKLRKRQREMRHRYTTPDGAPLSPESAALVTAAGNGENKSSSTSPESREDLELPPGVSSPPPSMRTKRIQRPPPTRSSSTSSCSSTSSGSSRRKRRRRSGSRPRRYSRSRSRSRDRRRNSRDRGRRSPYRPRRSRSIERRRPFQPSSASKSYERSRHHRRYSRSRSWSKNRGRSRSRGRR